jgi:multidrug efflux system outer membrane protein
MMRTRSLAALAGLCLLGGCAGPRPAPPAAAALAAPPAWRGQTAVPGAAVSATWWNAFDDPVLAQVVEETLARNDDIAIAAARVMEARALARLARSQQAPQVDAFAGGISQRAPDAFGEARDQTAGQAQLVIGYDADLFGRLESATAAARASLLASEAARDNVRLALASSAASGYLALRALDARLAILREAVRTREEMLRLIGRRTGAGYAPVLDERQARAELTAAQAAIPPTELAIRRQENSLAILMGGVPAPIARGAAWADIRVPETAVGIPSTILRRRPDIYEAEQRLASTDHSLDAARAAFMPSLRLTASGGLLAATSLPDPISIFSVGGSILAPLFDGGRLRAQADAAAARRDQAAFAYRRTVLAAFREVEDSLAAIDRSAEQEQRIGEQRIALADALRLASNRYRAGYSSYLEALDAQRALLAADLALVQVRSDRLLAHVQLFQALGGGWTEASHQ